ncbi:MAG: hypothetical protein QM756_45060 [Polyangiaceae bacterium]
MSKVCWSAALALSLACNVQETGVDTGGVGGLGNGGCPSGVSVVLSDYSSTRNRAQLAVR